MVCEHRAGSEGFGAAEFQLIVRMLLCGYMVANPQYLELDEVIGPAWETIKGGQGKVWIMTEKKVWITAGN